MQAQWRGERAQRGRFIIAFRPSLPGIHALLVWMSQLTSFDNWEPRALSKGATVIVLIGSPLLCWERKMLSNAIAPQPLKIRLAHIGHQRRRMSASSSSSFFIYRRQWFGALAVSLAPSAHAGTGSRISKSRERPPWPGEALEDWARIAWHSSWPIMTDVLIKVALAGRV